MALEPDGRRLPDKWVRLPPASLTIQLPGSDYILCKMTLSEPFASLDGR